MIKNLFNTSTHASNTLNSFKMLNKSISSMTKMIALSIGHLGNWASSTDESINEPQSSVMQLTEKLIESFKELLVVTECAQVKLQALKQKEDHLKQLRSKHQSILKDFKKSRYYPELSKAEQSNVEREIAQRESEFKRELQLSMKDIMLAMMKGLEVMSQRVMIISVHGTLMFESMNDVSLELSTTFNKALCDALRDLRGLNATPESEEDKLIAKPLHPQRIDTNPPPIPPRTPRRGSIPTVYPVIDPEIIKMRRKSEVPTPPSRILKLQDLDLTAPIYEQPPAKSMTLPIFHPSMPAEHSTSYAFPESHHIPPTPVHSKSESEVFSKTKPESKPLETIPFFFPEKIKQSTLCRKASIANVSEGLPKTFSFQDFEVGDIVTATVNYEGLNSDEHDLIVGDTLEISLLYDDGWAVGPCYRTGLSGVFPLDLVKRIGSSTKSFRPRVSSMKENEDTSTQKMNELRVIIPTDSLLKPSMVQSPIRMCPGDSSDDSMAPLTPDKSFFPERNTSKTRRSICIQKASLLGLEKLN